ncbi:MAG: hypothetical protein Q8N45_02640, partial [Anaerolineales bacterium]|nr:hypothetical protein [Anaerolineales bacterium]
MVKTRSTMESGIMFLSVFLPRDGRSIGEGGMCVKEGKGKKFFMAIPPEAWYIPHQCLKFWKNGEHAPRFP